MATRVVTVNDILDGHVGLDLECFLSATPWGRAPSGCSASAGGRGPLALVAGDFDRSTRPECERWTGHRTPLPEGVSIEFPSTLIFQEGITRQRQCT